MWLTYHLKRRGYHRRPPEGRHAVSTAVQRDTLRPIRAHAARRSAHGVRNERPGTPGAATTTARTDQEGWRESAGACAAAAATATSRTVEAIGAGVRGSWPYRQRRCVHDRAPFARIHRRITFRGDEPRDRARSTTPPVGHVVARGLAGSLRCCSRSLSVGRLAARCIRPAILCRPVRSGRGARIRRRIEDWGSAPGGRGTHLLRILLPPWVWVEVMTMRRWVVVHLADGTILYGYPRRYTDDPRERTRELYLEHPQVLSSVDGNKQYVPFPEAAGVLVESSQIQYIEVTENSDPPERSAEKARRRA